MKVTHHRYDDDGVDIAVTEGNGRGLLHIPWDIAEHVADILATGAANRRRSAYETALQTTTTLPDLDSLRERLGADRVPPLEWTTDGTEAWVEIPDGGRDFEYVSAIEGWFEKLGWSTGRMCAPDPIGMVQHDDVDIQKWRNLTAAQRAELHGRIEVYGDEGSFRYGPFRIVLDVTERGAGKNFREILETRLTVPRGSV